jgi:hypothetical protein
MLRTCTSCHHEKELEKFVKGEIYNGTQYYRYKCKECLNSTLRTGKENTGRFKKGSNHWVGRKHSQESKKKIGKVQKGRKQKPETIEKRRHKHLGQRRKATRNSSRVYWAWRDSVKNRDGWKCQHCGCEEKDKLHAHHIVAWLENELKRFDIENGITLCKNCHAKEETKHKKGVSFSKETEFKKGNIPWNRGKVK